MVLVLADGAGGFGGKRGKTADKVVGGPISQRSGNMDRGNRAPGRSGHRHAQRDFARQDLLQSNRIPHIAGCLHLFDDGGGIGQGARCERAAV